MTEENLYILRECRNKIQYVKKRLNADRQKLEITQSEVEIGTANLTKAFIAISQTIAMLRDGSAKPKEGDMPCNQTKNNCP